MKNEDQKFARVLIKNDIVDGSVVRELTSLQENLERKTGKHYSLAALLIHQDVLEESKVKKILKKMKDVAATAKLKQNIEIPDTKETAGSKAAEPVPGYFTEKVLSRSNTGAVFEVTNQSGERFALRMLYPEKVRGKGSSRRFLREGELLSEFDHVNLVKCHGFGRHEKFHYQVLEYIDGNILSEILQLKGSLKEEIALDLIYQIAKGLEYLDRNDLIHRDIRPDNIMVTKSGFVKILDLGLVEKGFEGEYDKSKYNKNVRDDIYSLGITFYQLATGSLPFEGVERREELAGQEELKAVSPRSRNEDVSVETESVIAKMMSSRRGVRYANPSEVIRDLDRIRWEQEPKAMEELGDTVECELCQTPNVVTRETCKTCGEPLYAPDKDDLALEDPG